MAEIANATGRDWCAVLASAKREAYAMEPPKLIGVWRKGGKNANFSESRPGILALRAALSIYTATFSEHSEWPRRDGLITMARLIAIIALGTAAFMVLRAARRVYLEVPDGFEPVGLLPPPREEPAID
jgi:hypothetical protein